MLISTFGGSSRGVPDAARTLAASPEALASPSRTEDTRRPSAGQPAARAGPHVSFRNRLWADATGYCTFYKRLDRGTYRIPLAIPPGATHVTATSRELSLILEGIDFAGLRAARLSLANAE